VLAWYYSDTHRSFRKMFALHSRRETPLATCPTMPRILNDSRADASKAPRPWKPDSRLADCDRTVQTAGPVAGGRRPIAPSAMKVPGLVDVPMR